MPETIEGYEDDRHPATEVLIATSDSDIYHEIRWDGEAACGVPGDYRTVSLETAVNSWTEPCNSPQCTQVRCGERDDDDFEADPDLFFGIHWRDAEAVDRAYWDYYWSQSEIQEWTGAPRSSIRNFMDQHDIPTRSQSEGQIVRHAKRRGESLESISEKVPDPRLERSESDGGEDGVEWSKLQE